MIEKSDLEGRTAVCATHLIGNEASNWHHPWMPHLPACSHDHWHRDTFRHDDVAVVHSAHIGCLAAAALATAGKVEDVRNRAHYAEAEEGTVVASDSPVEEVQHILVEQSIHGVWNSSEEVGDLLVDSADGKVEQKVDTSEVEEDLKVDRTAVLVGIHVEVDNVMVQNIVDVADMVVVVDN